MSEPEAIDELVARLRWLAGPAKPNVLDEAADLIEQMANELEELHAAANPNA